MSDTGARRPGLDGLRAVAVAAVVAYHVDPRAVPGGYLGVSVFFTLSGFLITSLLLEEVAGSRGRVDLRRFWSRRIRRLWPAAWLTLAAVAVADVVGVWGEGRSATLGGETLAALANVANWWQLVHDGYLAELVAPSPLRHMWSLAIEEQFYLLWPLALAFVTRRWWRATPVLMAGVVAGSLVATLTAGSVERVYLGTGTRAAELVIGAALAWWWRAHPRRGPEEVAARRAVTVVGGVAGAALLTAILVVPGDSGVWTKGGFVVVACCSATVVAAAVTRGAVATALSGAPLVWVGERSYAIYLFHWPILVALPPEWTTGARALACVLPTLVLAALSRRVLEGPVLAGALAPRSLAVGGAALAVLAVGLPRWVGVEEDGTVMDEVAASLEVVPDPTTPAPSTTGASGPDPPPPPPATPAPTGTSAPATAAPSTSPPPSAAPRAVPPPPTTDPCSVPGPGATPSSPRGTGVFDPATVDAVPDPASRPGCRSIRVLVVGDSTGRGVANGLRAVAPPWLEVWDRTVLGCSMGDVADCPDWRSWWPASVRDVRPDVVLAYLGAVTDVRGVADEPFEAPDAARARVAALEEAMGVLAASGAAVSWVVPPVPRPPEALFYCDGQATDSQCDPGWVAAWGAAVADAARARGARLVDVAGWVGSRGGEDARDRPDGLHFTGEALRAHARWLIPQLPP